MTKAIHIEKITFPGKLGEMAFTRLLVNLHVSSLALISLYGRFGTGLFECWIQ